MKKYSNKNCDLSYTCARFELPSQGVAPSLEFQPYTSEQDDVLKCDGYIQNLGGGSLKWEEVSDENRPKLGGTYCFRNEMTRQFVAGRLFGCYIVGDRFAHVEMEGRNRLNTDIFYTHFIRLPNTDSVFDSYNAPRPVRYSNMFGIDKTPHNEDSDYRTFHFARLLQSRAERNRHPIE